MLIDNPPVALDEGVWMLGTRAYPLYLIRDRHEAALIEGGTGATARLVAQQCEALGIDPCEVKWLIITHAHPDHVMAIPRLRRRWGDASVVASQAAATTLAEPKAIAMFNQIDQMLTASLAREGLVDDPAHMDPLTETRIPVDRLVGEGDRIPVGNLGIEVLATPGHSPCSLSLLEPQRRILFISDATGYYIPEESFWWPNYFADYGSYVQSIERLASLGARILALSHNGVLQGEEAIQKYFAEALAATRAYHQRIVAEARQGKTVREIGQQLGQEIHRRVPRLPLDFFEKNCTLLARLSLKHEGLPVEK